MSGRGRGRGRALGGPLAGSHARGAPPPVIPEGVTQYNQYLATASSVGASIRNSTPQAERVGDNATTPAGAVVALAANQHPIYAPLRLRQHEIDRIATDTEPPTYFNPEGPLAGRIRQYLVNNLPVGAGIVINVGGFTEQEIHTLAQDTDDDQYIFRILVVFCQRKWRTVQDAAGNAVRQQFRANLYVVCGAGNSLEGMVDDIEDHYGSSNLAISKMIITKLLRRPPGTTNRTAASRSTVAYAAAGFAEIICDEAVRPLPSDGPPKVYFPPTYGSSCYLHIFTKIFKELFPQSTPEQDGWAIAALSRIRLFITNKGMTTNAITKMNKYFYDEPVPSSTPNGRTTTIQIYKRTVDSARMRAPAAPLNTTLAPNSDLKKFYITAINYAGEFATAQNCEGGLHYVQLIDVPEVVTAAYRVEIQGYCADIIANAAKSVIHAKPEENTNCMLGGVRSAGSRVDYIKLHQINLEEMENARKAAEARRIQLEQSRNRGRKRKQRDDDPDTMQVDSVAEPDPESEAALAQQAQVQAATAWIACYDIESLFVQLPLDNIPQDLLDSGVVEGTACTHHPFLIHFGLFRLPASTSNRRYNTEFDRDTEEEEAAKILQAHEFALYHVQDTHEDPAENFIVNAFLSELSTQCRYRNIDAIYLFAHNGSKYDHHLLFEFYKADPKCKIDNILITPRGILGATFTYDGVAIHLRCTALHLQQSLNILCTDLRIPKCMSKKEFEFNSDFTHANYAAMPQEDKNKLKEYAEYDIYCMAFILIRIEALLQRLDPIRPCDVKFEVTQQFKPRCSHMTFQSFIRGMLLKTYFQSYFPPPRIILLDKLWLSSLRGGMTQTFTAFYISPLHTFLMSLPESEREAALPFIQETAKAYAMNRNSISLADPDRNSLYPYTMKSRGVPKGPPHLIVEGIEDVCKYKIDGKMLEKAPQMWGILLVKQTSPVDGDVASSFFTLMSYRTQNGESMLYTNISLNLITDDMREKLAPFEESFCEKDGWMWITTDHYAIYRLAGAKFAYRAGFMWAPEYNNWSMEYPPFINEMYTARQANRSNHTVQLMYKLAMNGSFGSSGQKATTTTHKLLPADEPLPPKHLITNTLSKTTPLGDGQFILYQLESKPGCTARDLSCKSTVTNSILSGSLRVMIEVLYTIAKEYELPFGRVLNMVSYMDTDSNYALAELVHMMDKLKLIGKDIGQYATEAGECIIRGIFPMAKVYYYEYVGKKDDGLALCSSGKCKGLPLYDTIINENDERISTPKMPLKDMYEKLITTGTISASKTVWHKGIGAGVQTVDTPYQVKGESFTTFSNKIGWKTDIDDNGNIFQRYIPYGYIIRVGDFMDTKFPIQLFSEHGNDAKRILEKMAEERDDALASRLHQNALQHLKMGYKFFLEK